MLSHSFAGGTTGTLDYFSEENAERVQAEQDAPVTVIVGNPPYNIGQMNENENNKNRIYERSRRRIKETYAKDSNATLSTKAYDLYAQFFRWATDRLGERDGIIAYVSNNSFLSGIALDGMRKSFADEFTTVYHVDLGGNSRKEGGGSVFGIRVGVGITFLVRHGKKGGAKIHYYAVNDALKSEAKLNAVAQLGSLSAVPWQEITPDTNYHWLNHGLENDYLTFPPMGVRQGAKAHNETNAIFKNYTLGVSTNRDDVVYDFDKEKLEHRVRQFIINYNAEVARWLSAPLSSKERTTEAVDSFVDYSRIKWSRNLKRDLRSGKMVSFDSSCLRQSAYRSYCSKWLYFADVVVDERGTSAKAFPDLASTLENTTIVLSDRGHRANFSALAVKGIPDLHILASLDGYQCFPFYTYDKDGTNRLENITDDTLTNFRTNYADVALTKQDIFSYIYALLHHPEYRTRYRENLKRELPRIPFVGDATTFRALADAGACLLELHTGYETVAEYPLKDEFDQTATLTEVFRVEKMKFSADRTAIVVNPYLTLRGIPAQAHEYKLGSRSALDWIIDQYRVKGDSDPNRAEEPGYIVSLIKRIVTVSVETVQIVAALPPLNLGDADEDSPSE